MKKTTIPILLLIYFLAASSAILFVRAQTLTETKTVDVSVTIAPHLTFTISGVLSGDPCPNAGNTGLAEVDSTANAISFGTYNGPDRVLTCQQTVISTNSTNGYNLTIQQNHDMKSLANDNINRFYGSSGSADTWTTPEVWSSPVNPYHSYFGFTTSDTSDFPQFVPARYAGFQTDNTEYQVVTASGPVADDTQYITYQIQFDALQESGMYTNTITYIASATF